MPVNMSRRRRTAMAVIATGIIATGAGPAAAATPPTRPQPGLVWAPPQDVDTTGGTIDAVSCATVSFCVAVDSKGNAVLDHRGTWSAPVPVAEGTLTAVSCASVHFCMAVGTASTSTSTGPLTVVYDRGTWTTTTSPVAGLSETLAGVSCVTGTTFCMAVGQFWFGGPGPSTLAQVFDGHTWTVLAGAEMTGYATGDYLSAVSCPGLISCVTGGTIGNRNDFGDLIETDTNGSWVSSKISDGATIGLAGGLAAVDCTGTDSCLAAGPGGYVSRFAQGQWSSPTDVDGASAITALSCPTAAICRAADTSGNVLTASKGSWGTPQAVDPGNSLSTLTCPRRNFCVAADTAGNVVVGSR
jgi:hypothetical protein